MSDLSLRLGDKTIIVAGPFGLLLQNLTAKLTECGADVTLITDDVKGAQRICQNIMDMREVSERFGRAAAIEANLNSEKDITDLFNRSAEAFGSADVYIDCNLWALNLPFQAALSSAETDAMFEKAYVKTQAMTKVAGAFMKGHSKNRILYMLHELDVIASDAAGALAFKKLRENLKSLAHELGGQHVSINALAIGISEDYLLSRFPKSQSIQRALKDVQVKIPHAKIVDYSDITNVVAFLASPLSQGINAQILNMDYAL